MNYISDTEYIEIGSHLAAIYDTKVYGPDPVKIISIPEALHLIKLWETQCK